MPFGLHDLHDRRVHGHDDGRGDAKALGVIGKALGVVAGRHRNDTAFALVGIERQELVERTAFLERRGKLQILELEPDFSPGQL